MKDAEVEAEGACHGQSGAADAVGAPAERRLRLLFTGTAGEYFRIWIVNTLLTIVTLGFYAAWAKVRTRRYFHANTVLDGEPFDYLAKPTTILRGYLIVAGGLVAIQAANAVTPVAGMLLTAAAWCSIPFLLYKAHRFKARNSSYRNIRFRFLGGVGEGYRAYVFYPLTAGLSLLFLAPNLAVDPHTVQAGPLLLGVAGFVMLAALALAASYPYLVFLQRRYLHDNLSYGMTVGHFGGTTGTFYAIYGGMLLLVLAAVVAGGVLIGVTGGSLAVLSRLWEDNAPSPTLLFLVGMATNLVFLLIGVLVQQYLQARTWNYSWSNTRLGPLRVEMDLGARELAWIRFTNILAMVASAGLLVPWAKVRRTRYILSRTCVLLTGDLEAFRAAAVQEEAALGDTAADFFDWDIGW